MSIAEKPMYSVIVPVFNSADTLEELMQRLEAVMSLYAPYELLFIDDFSTDGSWEKLKELKQGKAHIRLIRLTRNFGQAAVTICGINESRADILITIDDDLQYPPEEIPTLIAHFDSENQYLVFGVPKEKKTGWFQKINAALVEYFIANIVLRNQKKLKFSTFRILTKKKARSDYYSERTMRSIQVFFTMVSPHLMDYVYVNHSPRRKGKSNYTIFKRLHIAFELFLVTTEMPLYFFVGLSVLGLMSGFVVSLFMLTGWIKENTLSVAVLPVLLIGLSCAFFGFVVLFSYLRKIYLGYLGAQTYAVWEEK